MGNSLSKNDTSNSGMTAGATGTGLIGELESEEKVALSRQRHLPNDNNEFRNDRRNISNKENESDEQVTETGHSAIKIANRRGSAALHEEHLYKNVKVALNATSSSPRRARKLYLKDRSSELDLEIGLAAARSLQITDSSSGPDNLDNSSSSSSSPIFTLNGKDDDLLSMTSVGSPDHSTEVSRDSREALGSIEEFDEELDSQKSSTVRPKNSPRKFSLTEAVQKIGTLDSSNSSVTEPKASGPSDIEVDINAIIERLLGAGLKQRRRGNNRDKVPLSATEIKTVLLRGRSIFLTQPTLLRLSPPVKIVGDIHGQFEDLVRIFNICGYPPYSNYLFLGDYVDRGHKSLETFLLLMCFKIKYPENFFMLRGNHESANVTKIYGFYDECKRRLPQRKMWKNFVDVFNSLPLAAIISDKIFCVHGGLSPDLHNLSQIECLRRPTDVPDKGLLADLLWSDPDEKIRGSNWTKNDRGVSYCFGKKHVDYFCSRFKIDLIVRGHMVVEDGYEFFNNRKLVTVFSAPNYCGEFNNFGSVMSVDKRLCCSFELIKPRAG